MVWVIFPFFSKEKVRVSWGWNGLVWGFPHPSFFSFFFIIIRLISSCWVSSIDDYDFWGITVEVSTHTGICQVPKLSILDGLVFFLWYLSINGFDGRSRDNGGVSSSIKCNLHLTLTYCSRFAFILVFGLISLVFFFFLVSLFLKKLVVVVEQQ